MHQGSGNHSCRCSGCNTTHYNCTWDGQRCGSGQGRLRQARRVLSLGAADAKQLCLQGRDACLRTGQRRRRGLSQGQGTLVFPDGARYEGAFEGGSRSGRGLMTWPSGDVYNGLWEDDNRSWRFWTG